MLSKFINSKILLLLTGFLFISYLIFILVLTTSEQHKLKEYQDNQLHLRMTHYASSLDSFFNEAQADLLRLSKDNDFTHFVSKQHSQRLSNVLQMHLIQQYDLLYNISSTPIFKQIAVHKLDSTRISSHLSSPSSTHLRNVDLNNLIQIGHITQIEKLKNNISIQLLQLITLEEEPIAYLVAEINNDVILQQLTIQEPRVNRTHIALNSQVGDLLIWNSFKENNDSFLNQAFSNESLQRIEKTITNMPLTLVAQYDPMLHQGLLSSSWFIVLLSILILPFLWLTLLMKRVARSNRVLQEKIHLSEQHQQHLLLHNSDLETKIKQHRISEKSLKYQATHDSLTGLPNRNYSLKHLSHAIEVSRRNHTQILLMYIDLDNFKQINDTLGHSIGDQVLVESSKRLLNSLEKTDIVSRLGGDEFLLLLPDLKSRYQATCFAKKVLALFNKPFNIQGHELFSPSSIGLSIYPKDGETPEVLLKNADMALYNVKDEGRNSFSFYDPKMNASVVRNVNVIHRLRYAIENNKLQMYYQPLVDLQTGKIVGAEALMRWTDEELGFVSPEEFILLAERNGLIHQIGDFALTEACQQAAKWQAIYPLQIAVNFSSVQFRDSKALLAKIIATLKQTGLPSSKLDIEVTESLLIDKEDDLSEMLAALQYLNIQLSIDDFGTGYSALSYLQKYTFNKLKIDRAFVMNLAENEADRSLVTAIIAMAKALNMKIVAEGIEDKRQEEMLTNLNCDYGQGYLYSKALTAKAFEQLLIADNSEQLPRYA